MVTKKAAIPGALLAALLLVLPPADTRPAQATATTVQAQILNEAKALDNNIPLDALSVEGPPTPFVLNPPPSPLPTLQTEHIAAILDAPGCYWYFAHATEMCFPGGTLMTQVDETIPTVPQ